MEEPYGKTLGGVCAGEGRTNVGQRSQLPIDGRARGGGGAGTLVFFLPFFLFGRPSNSEVENRYTAAQGVVGLLEVDGQRQWWWRRRKGGCTILVLDINSEEGCGGMLCRAKAGDTVGSQIDLSQTNWRELKGP